MGCPSMGRYGAMRHVDTEGLLLLNHYRNPCSAVLEAARMETGAAAGAMS